MDCKSLKVGKGSMIAKYATAMLTLVVMMIAQTAFAQSTLPVNYQTGFQKPVTEVAEDIQTFHAYLFYLITVVTIFVTILLGYTVFRFRESANPTPSTNAHHTFLEVAWTIAPIIILLAISIPSFRLLYKQYSFPKPDITIKATGNQWYWSYAYPDEGELEFDSYMVKDADLKEGQPRLLTVDNAVVVPINKVVEVHIAATDVLHNWTVPAFGVKSDAVPGRLLRTWFKATKLGTYYGQCSELCGRDHAFMPIAVKVVSEADYAAWVVKAKEEFAALKTNNNKKYASRDGALKKGVKTAILTNVK